MLLWHSMSPAQLPGNGLSLSLSPLILFYLQFHQFYIYIHIYACFCIYFCHCSAVFVCLMCQLSSVCNAAAGFVSARWVFRGGCRATRGRPNTCGRSMRLSVSWMIRGWSRPVRMPRCRLRCPRWCPRPRGRGWSCRSKVLLCPLLGRITPGGLGLLIWWWGFL